MTTSRTHRPIRVAALASALVALAALTLPVSAQQPSGSPAVPQEPEDLTLLWQAGGPLPPKPGTGAMAIDPVTGDLWVAVPHSDQYWIMSPDGEYLESWGTHGSGPGQFRFEDPSQNVPTALGPIAFAPDGSFVIADLGNYRVQQFAPDRSFVREWGSFGTGDGQFRQPLFIATDGEIVAVGDCDRGQGDVQLFDTRGTFLRSITGEPIDGSWWCVVAMDPAGDIHVLRNESDRGPGSDITVFDREGRMLRTATVAGRQGNDSVLTVAPDGSDYVTTYAWDEAAGQVAPLGTWRVAPDGRTTDWYAPGGDGLLVSPDGASLYVSRGWDQSSDQWTFVRKYALSPS